MLDALEVLDRLEVLEGLGLLACLAALEMLEVLARLEVLDPLGFLGLSRFFRGVGAFGGLSFPCTAEMPFRSPPPCRMLDICFTKDYTINET